LGHTLGGRKPIPPELIDAAKHKKGKEAMKMRKQNTPTGCDGKLIAPRDLSPLAKKEWKRIIKLYNQLDVKILNDLDMQALKMYCSAKANYDSALKQYIEEGQHPTSEEMTRYGNKVVPNPLLKVMEQQTKIITSLSEQLCLTIVGRARMGMIKANEPKNPLKEFNEEFKDEE